MKEIIQGAEERRKKEGLPELKKKLEKEGYNLSLPLKLPEKERSIIYAIDYGRVERVVIWSLLRKENKARKKSRARRILRCL